MAKEKEKRNREIYEKKEGLNGYPKTSYDRLAKEYKIHSQRVVQIVRNFKIKNGIK